jgi:hypothetical protein
MLVDYPTQGNGPQNRDLFVTTHVSNPTFSVTYQEGQMEGER